MAKDHFPESVGESVIFCFGFPGDVLLLFKKYNTSTKLTLTPSVPL